MSSTRELKRRIRSVQNTKQITKAMEMVAAAKLRRAEARVVANRPYTKKLYQYITRLMAYSPPVQHPLLADGQSDDSASAASAGKSYLVITSDRGMCGGFNANILRQSTHEIGGDTGAQVMVVGRKGRDYFRRRGQALLSEYIYLDDSPAWHDLRSIGEYAIQMYNEGVIGEMHLVYNEFINALQSRTVVQKILPVEPPGADELPEPEETLYFRYEPGPEEVLDQLLPRFIYNSVYAAVLESKAAEHGARMSAMSAATRNADDMIDSLTNTYNQARQAAITQEILEIVNSAEALSQG